MLKWSLNPIDLSLRFPWKISREESTYKRNFIVQVEGQGQKGEGETALSSRYGDTQKVVEECFDLFLSEKPEMIEKIESLTNLLDDIEMPKGLRFGIESAYIHYLAAVGKMSVQQILCLNQVKSFPISFSLPIMKASDVGPFYRDHKLARFGPLKVKVDGLKSVDAVCEVGKLHKGKIRIDANESFNSSEEVIEAIKSLKGIDIEFLEQPLPSNMYEESRRLKREIDIPLIADESLVGENVTKELGEQFDGVNIKLMKSGGYIKALNQMQTAKNLGMKVLLGCMIETSLGISSAMNIADKADFFDLDGFLIIKNDPYNFVMEENGTIFYSLMY